MSQPPAGGYPPPDPSQPGGYPPAQPGGYPPPAQPGAYPPPAQPGMPGGSSPAGSSPAPAGGYPPPYPPPGAAPGGFQQPPPGYAPPPQGYAPPPAGYAPPAGGYPPPAAGYQPAGAPAFPPAARSGGSSFDISKITTVGWGVIGAAFLTLIASFFNFWSESVSGYGSAGISGWSLWWWIPVLLAIAVGVVYALTLFGVLKPGQIKPEFLFYGAAASFVLMIIVLIHTFAYSPFGGLSGIDGVSTGPGFGVWFALITTLALTYFTAMAAKNAGAKLPFKVPGPTLT